MNKVSIVVVPIEVYSRGGGMQRSGASCRSIHILGQEWPP